MLYLLISFSFGNNAPPNALGREVFPNTPKSDALLPDTASKALLRQIDEACEKREEGKGREGKARPAPLQKFGSRQTRKDISARPCNETANYGTKT